MSTVALRGPRHLPAAGVVGEHRAEHVRPAGLVGVAQHSAGPDEGRDVGERTGDSVGWAGRACRRTATSAASRASSRSRARSTSSAGSDAGALVDAGGIRRSASVAGRVEEVLAPRRPRRRARRSSACRGRPRRCGRATSGATTSCGQAGVLALGGRGTRVDVGRRATDVDDETSPPRDAASTSTPRSTTSGVAASTIAPKAGSREGPCRRSRGAGRARGSRPARRLRRDDPDLRQTLSASTCGDVARRGSRRPRPGPRRCPRRRPAAARPPWPLGQPGCVVQQDISVATVGATDEQHDVGSGGAESATRPT